MKLRFVILIFSLPLITLLVLLGQMAETQDLGTFEKLRNISQEEFPQANFIFSRQPLSADYTHDKILDLDLKQSFFFEIPETLNTDMYPVNILTKRQFQRVPIEQLYETRLNLGTRRLSNALIDSGYSETRSSFLSRTTNFKGSITKFKPLILVTLIALGLILIYFLFRPLIKIRRSKVIQYNKKVDELQPEPEETPDRARQQKIAPESIHQLRCEVMSDIRPAVHIIRTWIQER
jgi:hypothetical protein